MLNIFSKIFDVCITLAVVITLLSLVVMGLDAYEYEITGKCQDCIILKFEQ